MPQNEDPTLTKVRELLEKTLEAASRKHSGTAGDLSNIQESLAELRQAVKEMHARLFVNDNGTQSFSTRLWLAEQGILKLQGVEVRREDDKSGFWNHVKRQAASVTVSVALMAVFGVVGTILIVTRTTATPPPQPQVQAADDDKKAKEKELEALLQDMKETKRQIDEVLAERRRRPRLRPQFILPPFRPGASFKSGDVIATPAIPLPMLANNRGLNIPEFK